MTSSIYKALGGNSKEETDINKLQYKVKKREANNAVTLSKSQEYRSLQNIEPKDGGKGFSHCHVWGKEKDRRKNVKGIKDEELWFYNSTEGSYHKGQKAT